MEQVKRAQGGVRGRLPDKKLTAFYHGAHAAFVFKQQEPFIK